MEIVELIDHPHLIPTVVALIKNQWPDPNRDAAMIEKRLMGDRKKGQLPTALIALSNTELYGFVSLVKFEQGVSDDRPFWIDALYVEPGHRGKGLGLALVAAAERKAAALGLPHLLALTEIPDLYRKAGWVEVEGPTTKKPRDYIMKKEKPTA